MESCQRKMRTACARHLVTKPASCAWPAGGRKLPMCSSNSRVRLNQSREVVEFVEAKVRELQAIVQQAQADLSVRARPRIDMLCARLTPGACSCFPRRHALSGLTRPFPSHSPRMSRLPWTPSSIELSSPGLHDLLCVEDTCLWELRTYWAHSLCGFHTRCPLLTLKTSSLPPRQTWRPRCPSNSRAKCRP